MGNSTIFERMIEEKLLNIHTAFIGKIISVSGNTAKVQPLNKVKQYGREAEQQSVLQNVPILNNARFKLQSATVEYVSDVDLDTNKSDGYVTSASIDKTTKTIETVKRVGLTKGDIVFCVCADRDITEARRGNMAVPSIGHHSQSDAVIVGVL